ncbi:MAG: ABC transporter ATP-binding protein [Burkholderiaceae bacterium]
MPDAILKLDGVSKRYAGVVALDGVSFDVERGTITSLIGPNGSGKSTLIDCISGFQRHDGGRWWVGGSELSGRAPWEIVRAGLSRTFQTVRVYGPLSVHENLALAMQAHRVPAWHTNLLAAGFMRRFDAEARQRAAEVGQRIGLGRMLDSPAAALSYGQQKLVALGCALIATPRLIVLDEPLAGVNPTLCLQIGELLDSLRAEGLTILLVEHNMDFVMRMSDRVIVLDRGTVLAQGSAAAIQADERVLRAYIGVPAELRT